jgi:MFS family permease
MLGALQGNARVMFATVLCWALPMSYTGAYLQLYMADQGISKLAIGTLASAQMAAQIVGALLGGWLAERWGFRRTLLTFDWLTYVLMFGFYIAGGGYFPFLAGGIAIGLVSLVGPAWTGLFVASVPPSRRAQAYSLQAMGYLAGQVLVSPAGLLVGCLGLAKASRIMFIFGIASISLGVWIRSRYLRNPFPPRGGAVLSLASLEAIARGHWTSLVAMLRRRTLGRLFVIQVLLTAIAAVWGTYVNLYLVDPRGVGLPPATIAIFPLLGGVMTVLVTVFVMPHVSRGGFYGYLIMSNGLMMLNAHLLLLAPAGALGVVAGAAVVGSAGWALFQPTLNALWVNAMGDRERPHILALANALVMLFTVPIPTMAGALYEIHPRGPLLMALLVQGVMLAMLAFQASRGTGGGRGNPRQV